MGARVWRLRTFEELTIIGRACFTEATYTYVQTISELESISNWNIHKKLDNVVA